MAKPNFKFQKRQKELEKKRKSEEKIQRKLDKTGDPTTDDQPQAVAELPANTEGAS